MNSHSPVQLVPTYFGFIESTYDALVLFEACLTGLIAHVPRRPHDREREHVIKSGNIFIYEESTSGIKRWTDGISWSPSRILGNFLIYRQLQKPFGPGEKKKALKKPKGPNGISKSNSQINGRSKNTLMQVYNNPNAANGAYAEAGKMNPDIERALIGSLVDSYDFMDDGLVKKTISVVVNGITHHLVSYYTLADAAARKFLVPTKDPKFLNLVPRPALLNKQSFRGPVDEVDPLDRMVYGRNRYDMTNQSMVGQSISYMPPDQNSNYQQNRGMYGGNYSVSSASPTYDTTPTSYSAAPIYGAQFAPVPGIYPAPHSFSPQEAFSAPNHRYSIVSSASSDGSRVQMPAAPDRRAAAYHHGTQDSGLPSTNNIQSASEVSTSYYQRPRESGLHNGGSISGINAPPTQRSLPSLPHQNNENFRPTASAYDVKPVTATHYDLKPAVNNHYDMGLDNKNSMWHMAGNTAVGHGHYQQAWPATAGH